MNCPACESQLTRKNVDSIEIDVCLNGCGGIWFDQFELKKLNEPHEMPAATLNEIDQSKTKNPDHTKRRNCPKCSSMVMMRHFYSTKREVEVDQCPKCAGFWLDAGELTHIHRKFPNENDKAKIDAQYFDEAFGKELTKMSAESRAKAEAAQKIAHIFRFLCPSYYIPGKQSGGAF